MHGRCGKSWYKFVLMAVAGIAVAGLVVMALWNWLMPAIFGMHTITYWQAFGLLVLSKIIFGGFRGGRGRGCGSRREWRDRMTERWDTLSPEAREKAREAMRQHWCGEPPIEPKSDSAV